MTTCTECSREGRHVATKACGELHDEGTPRCWEHRCDRCRTLSPLDQPRYSIGEIAAFEDRRVLIRAARAGEVRDARLCWLASRSEHVRRIAQCVDDPPFGGSCRVQGTHCLDMARALWVTGGVCDVVLSDADGNDWHWFEPTVDDE